MAEQSLKKKKMTETAAPRKVPVFGSLFKELQSQPDALGEETEKTKKESAPEANLSQNFIRVTQSQRHPPEKGKHAER